MSNLVSIPTALCLPAPDIEALVQGRMVAVMPRTFINPGQQFVLHPCDVSTNLLPVEQYYRSSFLPIARTTLTQLGSETALIKAWARCESCQGVSDTKALAVLSQLSVWTEEGLQEVLRQQQHIFLAYLRVYQLPQPIEVAINPSTKDKIGKFIGLPNSLTISESLPVLSDRIFTQRRHQLEKLEPPLHPELEELQSAIAQLDNPDVQQLNNDIKQFLGWASNPPTQQLNSQPAWINTITELGNRTKEQDTGKSNYQAGTDFENVVRDSLEFLGFTIDYSHKGGAGGLDLFCSKPYSLVGECKAGRKIPNTTAVQLLNLGTLRLQSKERFRQAAKLIIGPGEPTKQLEEAAEIQGMAIINPETLEKLVKLQSKYRGSVDLFQLKEYLKPGQADDEVEKYIDQVSREIRLRSHLVQLVKNFLEDAGLEQAGVDALYGAYFGSKPPQPLQLREMHDILVELSSPLTGYVGRIKGSDWQRDRFYFLRDLKVD
jgi:hypothetical protein